MRYTRTPIAAGPAFTLATVKVHARIDGSEEDYNLTTLAETAASEIEAYCDIALLAQKVTAEADAWGDTVPLPVGPFYGAGAAQTPVKVWTRDDLGELTEQPAAGWIMPGRYPVLHLTRPLAGRSLVVEYPAGFGDTDAAIPADLQTAIMDQATRLYAMRGDDPQAEQGLSVAASRICSRHRRVRV